MIPHGPALFYISLTFSHMVQKPLAIQNEICYDAQRWKRLEVPSSGGMPEDGLGRVGRDSAAQGGQAPAGRRDSLSFSFFKEETR